MKNDNIDYQYKYLKYKNKYITVQDGGASTIDIPKMDLIDSRYCKYFLQLIQNLSIQLIPTSELSNNPFSSYFTNDSHVVYTRESLGTLPENINASVKINDETYELLYSFHFIITPETLCKKVFQKTEELEKRYLAYIAKHPNETQLGSIAKYFITYEFIKYKFLTNLNTTLTRYAKSITLDEVTVEIFMNSNNTEFTIFLYYKTIPDGGTDPIPWDDNDFCEKVRSYLASLSLKILTEQSNLNFYDYFYPSDIEENCKEINYSKIEPGNINKHYELTEYVSGELKKYAVDFMYNFEFITRENEITKKFIKKADTSPQNDETMRTYNLSIFQKNLEILLSSFLAEKIKSNNEEKLIVLVKMDKDGQKLRIYLYKRIPKKSDALLRKEEDDAKAAKNAALWDFVKKAEDKLR